MARRPPEVDSVLGRILILNARGWAACGFPRLVLDDKLAASLCATHLNAEALADIKLPWSTFVVQPPPGLIFIEGHSALFAVIRSLANGKVGMYAVLSNSTSISSSGITWAELCEPDFLASIEYHHPKDDNIAMSPDMASGTAVLARLCANAIVEMETLPTRSWQSPSCAPKRKRGEPKCWTFRLSRRVVIDCRNAVRAATRGGGAVPSVQVLVRGHRKRQPFGPGREMRRWIHVEPYWRGPEDAPIAVREHLLER